MEENRESLREIASTGLNYFPLPQRKEDTDQKGFAVESTNPRKFSTCL
jgi:hypothetical protein